jgi:hypothetical protein
MKTKSKTKNMNRIWIGIGIAMVALLLAGGIVSAATGLTIPTILIADQNGNAKQIFNAGDQIRLGVYVNNPSTSPDSVTLTSSIIYGNGNTIITNAPYTVTIPGKSTPGWYWADTIPSNAPAGIYYYKVTASDSQGSVTQMAVFQIKNVVTVTVPAAPTGLGAVAVDGTSIRLSWNDNSNNENGFEISNGVTSVKVGANTNSYTWSGLTPGQYMCFMVRSYNAAGSSAWTPYACTTTFQINNVKSAHAIAWAESNPPAPADLKTWSGWCEVFVEGAFGTRYQYSSAQVAANNLHASKVGSPNIGSLVFFQYGTSGHVGIYIGNNKFISATTNSDPTKSVQIKDMTTWAASYPYEGWADAPANWPGR